MNIKENILSIPVWKVALIVIFMLFTLEVLFEEMIFHQVFRLFDRAILNMEKIKQEDESDLRDMDRDEEKTYCRQYQKLQRQKAELEKEDKNNFNYSFDVSTVRSHEIEINSAIKNHLLDPKRCDKERL